MCLLLPCTAGALATWSLELLLDLRREGLVLLTHPELVVHLDVQACTSKSSTGTGPTDLPADCGVLGQGLSAE
jgi:hypothetical protein